MIEFMQTEDEIVGYLARVMRADVRSDQDGYYLKIRGLEGDREFPLTRERLRSVISVLRAKELGDETALYTDYSFEIIVNEENQFPSRRIRDDAITLTDTESTITYEVSPASDEYLVWLIATASSRGIARDLWFTPMPPRYRLGRLFEENPNAEHDALAVLRALHSRLLTLKLVSVNKQTLRRFQAATHSFIFHIAYNLDIALVPQRFLEEVSRRGRISRMRRARAADLDPPRRIYNEDLVNHYVLAISTDSPTVQFLSHYHVLEHFFESVFNDDLIDQIKSAITQPGFSYKRRKDVTQLITTIKKSLQIRSETITFSEIEALRLSITKFVDIPQLLLRIEEYEPQLVEYYATMEVPFSKGSTIAFRSGDTDRITRELARRIYATRNALVHSKDGDKARYIPFKDERALVTEVPLMRFVSEMVILTVSELA